MIECVTAANAARHAEILDQMFRGRHDVFVKARGWSGLGDEQGRERDQFDTDDAVYLISTAADGRLNGSLRLVPTVRPHLMSELFPHFAVAPVPRGPAIYEMTRYFTVRDRERAREMRRATGELLCAMFEYCLLMDGAWITTLFDTFYLRRMRENGWGETALGPPTPYAEGTAIAIRIPVSERNLERTRRTHGVQGAVLRHAPAPVRILTPLAVPKPQRGRELVPTDLAMEDAL